MAFGILQLISSTGFYGAERVLLELSSYLHSKHYAVHIAVLTTPSKKPSVLLEKARERALNLQIFPCHKTLDLDVLRSLKRYIEKHHIGLIHSHNYKSDFYAYSASRNSAIKLVATCHNWLTNSFKLLAYEWLDKLILHHFDRIIAVSPPLLSELRRTRIVERKLALIENGLNLDKVRQGLTREEVRKSLGLNPDDQVLISVGRLDSWKRYDLLLEALKNVIKKHSCKLLLVGDGPEWENLEAQIERLELPPYVVMTGYRTDIANLLEASDIFVISSCKEGLPMVLLEAMASRKAIVSTNVGGIPNVLESGRTGEIVQPGDSGALAEAIIDLLKKHSHRLLLGTQAYETYKQRYSREAMGEKYVDLYQELLKS